MISNLKSARALIQADLDHARNVLQLWQDQVDELEKALTQLAAVDTSRGMLRVEYGGQKGSAPLLAADATVAQGRRQPRQARTGSNKKTVTDGAAKDGLASKRPKKRRALKPNSEAVSASIAEAPTVKRRTRGAKKAGLPPAGKYKDPASEKTWSGRGRRPGWMRGEPDQYLVTNLGPSSRNNPDAPASANSTAS